MNVFKFSIFIKSKDNSDIKKSIINCYSQRSQHTSNYKEFVEKKWREIEKEQIKTIYSERAIMTYNNISNTMYFLVEIDEYDASDQVTYDVIVLSSLEDVSEALNYVFDDIKGKLNCFKLKLIDNKALLFIYADNDIISNSIMIKSNVFSYTGFKMRETIRMLITLLLAVIAFIISLSSSDSTLDNVSYSVIASCIFFAASEAILKINVKKTVEIKDLTNWVEKHDKPITPAKDLNDAAKNLQNPNF